MKRLAGSLLILIAAVSSNSQTERIAMQPVQHLRKGAAEWQIIANPHTDAERKINGYLSYSNEKVASALKECDKNYAERMREDFGKEKMGGELTKFFNRDVHVTMSGPGYLSEVATVTFYCGGVHPYMYTEAVIFNLETGEPADPLSWLTGAANASHADEDAPDHALEGSIVLPALVPIYQDLTHHDCDNIKDASQAFLVWPDARSGHIVVQADLLPGSAGACGIPAELTPDQARKLGFDESLLGAIEQAHRMAAAAPRPAKPVRN